MAQPPLSQQIRQLEQEIGVKLLARTNRRVELTDAGQTFLKEARTILLHVEEATALTRRIAQGEAGRLSISFVSSAMYDVLPIVLRLFQKQHPDVEIELMEIHAGDQAEALLDRRIHIGFARLTDHIDGLVRKTVVREPLILALPTEHRLTNFTEIRLIELAHEPFIIYPPKSSYSDYILNLCTSAGFEPWIVQMTGEMQTAIGLVAAGIGITLVPSAVQNLRREGVVYLPIVEPIPSIELTMTYREHDTSFLLPRFIHLAMEVAKNRAKPLTSGVDHC